jgi:hypothetical protein
MGVLDKLKALPRGLTRRAESLRNEVGAALKEKAVQWRDGLKPQMPTVSREPLRERAFGREGGEDVKHIVWAGHVVRNGEGQSFYGAVGATHNGYYRAASVQVYGGAEEKWNWNAQRHTEKRDAIASAAVSPAMKYGGGDERWNTHAHRPTEKRDAVASAEDSPAMKYGGNDTQNRSIEPPSRAR